MLLERIVINNYRSLRNIDLLLGQLNVITGPNGSGKSNLYRALWLIAQISEGNFASAICREGGLLSAFWAGPRRSKNPLRMALGIQVDGIQFRMECGFPPPGNTAYFQYDPEIKEEWLWQGPQLRPSTTLLHRQAGHTWIRDAAGTRVDFPLVLSENESVLSQLRDPRRFADLFQIRETIRDWRFYHHFRTDDESPLRSPQVGVRTPVLSHDGRDLAAALATILEIGDRERLQQAISSGLPGRELEIVTSSQVPFAKTPRETELLVTLETEGCQRPLLARELSDGTLKFLCLVATLLSPRPPQLIALNEPETSLHPDLLPALAELIVHASRTSQIWVCSHSERLVECIATLAAIEPIALRLENGETVLHHA